MDPSSAISPIGAAKVYRRIDPNGTDPNGTDPDRTGPNSDVQRVVAEGPGFALCDFDCPPGHPRWETENRIVDGFNLAFPRGAVEIAPNARPSFVADSTQAVLYRDDDRYRRRRLGPHGDRATVLLFAPDRVERALEEHGVPRRPTGDAIRTTPRDYLALRRLRARLEASSRIDREVERQALDLLGGAVRAWSRRPPRTDPAPAFVRQAQALLNQRHAEPLSVATVAAAVGVTAPHLCRTFRRHLGATVHGTLVEIRLRAAIDLLHDTDLPLAEVALASGFSHQSHLTETLRRTTGTTPGRIRLHVTQRV